MRTSGGLAWALLRGGGRRDVTGHLLGVLAFAVSTGLLLVTLGVDLGLSHRADRQAWTVPLAARARSFAVAVQSTRTEYFSTRPVTVVTLARTVAAPPAPPASPAPPAPPAPPGLAAFPPAGSRWMSPALDALVRSDPALAQRWPGRTEGRVGAAGLAAPDQLLVVVGADQNAAALQAAAARDITRPASTAGPVPVAGFAAHPVSSADTTYRDLALVASVLLLVPLLVLSGAAARLGLARRDARLAAFRLAGASTAQVLGVVACEAALTALAGAVLGVLPYAGAVPMVSRVPVAGAVWYPSDLWVGAGVLLAVLVAVVGGGVLSALVTLRRVVVSPLGVAQRHEPGGQHLWRLLLFGVAVAIYLRRSRGSDPSATGLVLAFGVVFLTLSLIGPWVMTVLGRVMVAAARGPARLMAGRRLLEDPRAAWRTVGGLALTGFVAGFLALFPTSTGQVTWGSAAALNVAVPAAQAAHAATAARNALVAAGLPARVEAGDPGALLFTTVTGAAGHRAGGGGPAKTTAYLTVPVTPHSRETTRTVLARALPGAPIATGADIASQDDVFGRDLRTASLAVLAASFLVAVASAGITACAAVLDRRRTYQLLHLAGVPLSVLDRARRAETTAPLLTLVGGSLVTGLLCSAPLTKLGLSGGRLDTSGVALLAGTVLLGLAGVRAASAASRPLLRAVTTGPQSSPN